MVPGSAAQLGARTVESKVSWWAGRTVEMKGMKLVEMTADCLVLLMVARLATSLVEKMAFLKDSSSAAKMVERLKKRLVGLRVATSAGWMAASKVSSMAEKMAGKSDERLVESWESSMADQTAGLKEQKMAVSMVDLRVD